jgi:hypothetical protein
MMKAVWTSETVVNLHQSIRSYNLEDSNLRTHRRENLKSHNANKLRLSVKKGNRGMSPSFQPTHSFYDSTGEIAIKIIYEKNSYSFSWQT